MTTEASSNTLTDIVRWGGRLDGFTENHAIDGLSFVQGYMDGTTVDGRFTEGTGTPNDAARFLFGLDLAWLLWLDDCFDKHHGSVFQICDILDPMAHTRESNGFQAMKNEVLARSTSPEDSTVWVRSTERLLESWIQEQRISSGDLDVSYSEYLEIGIDSAGVLQIVTTGAIACHQNIHSRLGKPRFDQLIRHLSVLCRLQNDYYSAEKERQEGCRANAVLLMETLLDGQRGQARQFIASEIKGYGAMLEADILSLGEEDEFFCKLAMSMIASQEKVYNDHRLRYEPGD